MTWDQIPTWLFTAIVGGLIVKGLDLLIGRLNRSRDERRETADRLLGHISLFGELVQLYRFLANLSREVQQNEEGVIIRDDVGKPVIETKVFSIDPELESALSAMKGSDLRRAIAQQIVRI